MGFAKNRWQSLAAAVVMCVVGAAATGGGDAMAGPGQTPLQRQAATAPAHAGGGSHAAGAAGASVFDRQTVYTFLAAVKQAEAIADPLQRCLKYPDPPGSHWSPSAVQAYCRYHAYKETPYEDIVALLQRGNFDEVERQSASLLQAKLSNTDMRPMLDYSFRFWFSRPDLELRPLLENWKRAKPNSAFAYAASGISYEAMADHARGSKFASDTPASSMEAMERLMALADADLRRAVELDPRVTPVYPAMISVARHSLGDAYFKQALQAAFKADAANFHVYDELMWAMQPQWGGSLKQMAEVGKLAKKHAAENPMLLLLSEKALAREAKLGGDDCSNPDQFPRYPVIFDELAVSSQLLEAGQTAAQCGHLELSVVYYSEALRFQQDDDDTRTSWANELNDFDESALALMEMGEVLKRKPHDARTVFSHGYAAEALDDYKQAEKDYSEAVKLEPGDLWYYAQLASLYLEATHDWDKAWKLDERMVELFPNEPYVWLLRASIQRMQPRPGLKATADYFEAHFDKSPPLHQELLKMRAAQALEEGRARAAAKAPAG